MRCTLLYKLLLSALPLLAAVLFITGIAFSQQAQPPAGDVPMANESDDRTTILRPGGDVPLLNAAQSRDALLENVERIVVQANIKGQIVSELKKKFDGTAQTAIPIHVIELMLAEDFVNLTGPLASGIEDHRYSVKRLVGDELSELAAHQSALVKTNDEIQSLADVIVDGQDAAGQSLTPDQIESKKRVMYTRILHRRDLQDGIDRCKRDIAFHSQELRDLQRLEQRLDGMSEEQAAHVERVMAAIQNEHSTLVSQDVKANQEILRQAVNVLRAWQAPDSDLPTSGDNQADRTGAGIGSALQLLHEQRPLNEDDLKLVEKELQEAMKRRGQ